jgi:hypothetical protein
MTYLTDRQVAQNCITKGAVTLRWYDTRWAERIARPVDVTDKALGPLVRHYPSLPAHKLIFFGIADAAPKSFAHEA